MKTRKTMRHLLYFFLTVFTLSFIRCEDKPKPDAPDKLPLNLQEVNELIAKGGKIECLKAKRDVDELTVEKSNEAVNYEEPRSGAIYWANSVKTKKHYSITENPNEFVTLDPWDMLWPGALIQGASLYEGVPVNIPIFKKRQPGRIYLSVVSGNPNVDSLYKEVPMRGSDVTQAMNDLLKQHLNSNPARTSFEIKKVSNIEEMALKLGINLKLYGVKLNSEFGTDWKKDKNYVAVKLNQIFFTMNYEGPDGGYAGVFTDNITANDLKNYTAPNNPICYVSSVSYGRTFILLYESSANSSALELALSVSYMGNTGNLKSMVKKVFEQTSCKLVQIGGDPLAGLETVFGDSDKLKEFVLNGAVVSPTNIGVPLSYKINHLTDNTTVRLSNTLDYDVTEQYFVPVTPQNNVIIDVFNATLSLVPKKGKTISNHSTFKLKRVAIGKKDSSDNGFVYKEITPEKNSQCSKNGADIPIYGFASFQRLDRKASIRIECDFYVKNQLYNFWGTDVAEREISVVQEFRFNKKNNTWEALGFENANETEKKKPYYMINFDNEIGQASTNIKLNYRFECDGQVLPIESHKL